MPATRTTLNSFYTEPYFLQSEVNSSICTLIASWTVLCSSLHSLAVIKTQQTMKKGISIMVGLALVIMGHAQSDERVWGIGIHGGLVQYNGDRGQGFYSTEQAAYGFGRI